MDDTVKGDVIAGTGKIGAGNPRLQVTIPACPAIL